MNTDLPLPVVGTPCPGCGSHHVIQVTPTWPNLLCRTCGACWAPGEEGFHRVSAETCPGCPQASYCRVVSGAAEPETPASYQ